MNFFETELTEHKTYRMLNADEIYQKYKNLEKIYVNDIWQKYISINK